MDELSRFVREERKSLPHGNVLPPARKGAASVNRANCGTVAGTDRRLHRSGKLRSRTAAHDYDIKRSGVPVGSISCPFQCKYATVRLRIDYSHRGDCLREQPSSAARISKPHKEPSFGLRP